MFHSVAEWPRVCLLTYEHRNVVATATVTELQLEWFDSW